MARPAKVTEVVEAEVTAPAPAVVTAPVAPETAAVPEVVPEAKPEAKPAPDQAPEVEAEPEVQVELEADEVTVIVAVHISGLRNGEPWPAPGEQFTIPADEAERYLAFGYVTAAE